MIEIKNIKIFTDNIEESALSTIYGMVGCKAFEEKRIRIMPDVHNGNGTVVGLSYTIDLSDEKEMINPDFIGCDIGCSVSSVFFDKPMGEDKIHEFEHKIRKEIPLGVEINPKKKIDPKEIIKAFNKAINRLCSFYPSYSAYIRNFKNEQDLEKWCKRVKLDYGIFLKSLGSVGGGNHFIEYDVNEELKKYCVTIHCGSRNIGLKAFKYWHNVATNPKYIKDGGLNGFLYGGNFKGYIIDLLLAQEYAKLNHKIISDEISKIYKKLCGGKVVETISTMHNYIDFNHSETYLRKGAIASYVGEKMVIPFNMRDGLAVCEGKSNEDWNYTAPHGAGRAMSRAKARQTLDVEQYKIQLAENEIYSTTANSSTIDEAPDVYKPTDEIIELIEPTVEILYFMKPKINIKSGLIDEEI